MEKNNQYELPRGWAKTTLGQICEPSKEKFNPLKETNTIFIGLEHVESNTGRILEIGKSSDTRSTKTAFRSGDVLYGKLRPYLNKVCVPNFDGVCSTDILVFQKNPYLESKYLSWFLSTSDFVRLANQNVTGIQHPRVSFDTMSEFGFPLPPLNEQERIILKIEELFSELDFTIESLEKTQLRLQQYKRSLLKYAFQGILSEVWRDSNHKHIETGHSILQKIRSRERNKEKFAEISEDEISKLPKIPNEWSWTYFSNLGELNRGRSMHRPRDDPSLFGGKYPFIQTGIVRNSQGKITSYEQTYNEKGLAQSRLFPEGTLCITIAANIAETGILTFPACFPDSVVGFTPLKDLINSLFVMHYIKSNQSKLEKIAPATAQKNINLDILRKVAIPIMSYQEQCIISNEIEKGFSIANQSISSISSQISDVRKLRMIILKSAFEGKLVPQDPNDEPAEILLQKIRQERKLQIRNTKRKSE